MLEFAFEGSSFDHKGAVRGDGERVFLGGGNRRHAGDVSERFEFERVEEPANRDFCECKITLSIQ